MDGRHPLIPTITPTNEAYWKGGEQGQLRIQRCQDCGYWIHPPSPVCPSCLSRDVRPEPTSGLGSLFTYTFVHHPPGNPLAPVPHLVGMVELREQAGLRVTTNIVNCEWDEVDIGMPLQVVFEPSADLFIPLFEPEQG